MFSPKQVAIRIMARYPVYRVLPPGAVRTYAALKYHGQHSTGEQITRLVRSMNAVPTRYLSTALVAARAALRTGQDDLVVGTLDAIERRFPEAAGQHELRSDLHAYYGRYDQALASAQRARLLEPSSSAAAARVVRLGYRSWPRDEADDLAVSAVRRFPLSSEVLWAVAKACASPDQYVRIESAWNDRFPQVTELRAVRQLAMAATRGGRLDAAIELYGRAIVALYDSGRPAPKPAVRKLEGRGAWGAIEDIRRTLDGAGVPYFFAAGTALGLVREGRPLDADNDIDVGIFHQYWDRDALIALFAQDPRFDLDLHPLSRKVCVRHRGGSPVDLFRFYEERGQIWHDGVFVRWHNTPFRVVQQVVHGRCLPLPDDADRYLTENYRDWRTPNSRFDPFTHEAPNMEVTWPEYHRLHLVRRAYRQLTVGDVHAARQSLRGADTGDLGARIGTAV